MQRKNLARPIVAASLMIIGGIILLSWRGGSMKLAASAVFLGYPIGASALAGASQVVRKFGLAAALIIGGVLLIALWK